MGNLRRPNRMAPTLCAATVACLSLAASRARAEEHETPGPAPVSAVALRELGRRLFFDPVATSRSGMRACADCHRPDHGFSDPVVRSADDTQRTARHAQAILDVSNRAPAHWDGEFESVAGVTRARLEVRFDLTGNAVYGGSDERPRPVPRPRPTTPPVVDAFAGFVDASTAHELPAAAEGLESSGRYREAFAAAYGREVAPTVDRVTEAVDAFCSSIRSGVSPFDRHRQGQEQVLSASARRGLKLFQGRAGCARCHTMGFGRAEFTDLAFHNTGVSWKTVTPGVGIDEKALLGDLGRFAHTERFRDLRAFKTPTLRDVARRGPYMHDGSLATLEDVVRHYATPSSDPALDPKVQRFAASDADVADLVAFLHALTSDVRPGTATVAWDRRVPTTRLRLLDAAGEPLRSWPVTLVPAGDVLPGLASVAPRATTTSADGWISFAPGGTTHTRLVLDDEIAPKDGDLVPDTCREAVVAVPVRGRASLEVRFPAGWAPPPAVTVRHPRAPTFPHRQPPVTTLRSAEVEPGAGGAVRVRYDGPFRLDVGDVGEVELRGPDGRVHRRRVLLAPDAVAVVTPRLAAATE